MKKNIGLLFLAGLCLFFSRYLYQSYFPAPSKQGREISQVTPRPSVTPTLTPTPTPVPLTFDQMNERWGPCVKVPVLMYHHVQPQEQAQVEGHQWMTVSPETFKEQMAYLQSRGYQTISPVQLAAFFNQGTALPGQAIMITFDDGYLDLNQHAAPVLRENGFRAVVFLPTGLMNNPGYLSWEQIMSLKDVFSFGNHTWSHVNVGNAAEKVQDEISTADSQLADRGLNSTKIFAYPMGVTNNRAQEYLSSLGYQLAFTTQSGSVLCKQRRLALPRIRIGEAPLSSYGF